MINYDAIVATLPRGLKDEREILTRAGIAAGINPEGMSATEARRFLRAYDDFMWG